MTKPAEVLRVARLRAVMLELVYLGHKKQEPRMDDAMMYLTLSSLRHDVTRNEVVTLLQDLGDREYLKFRQEKDEWSGRVTISQIQITPKGRDLIEETASDPAVRILR